MPTWVGLIRDARSVAHERMREAAAGCRDAEVIVATNLTQVLGWQLAREREVPLVRALLNAPAYWMSQRTSRPAATAIRQGAWLAARPWLNRVRREALGLGSLPLGEPIGQLDRERQLVLYPFSPSVFPKPSGWGDWTEVTGYWFLDARVDLEPPDDLRAFVEAGPPPVCMGFATQLDPDPVATTRMMIEALRSAGRRGVLLRKPEALEGVELRDDVYALERVPHDWLFPRCQAVVHHAGAGTTATVLRTGVPSVAVPHNADQFTWARRLAELRVGPPPIPRRKLSRQGARDGPDRRHDVGRPARARAGPRGAHPPRGRRRDRGRGVRAPVRRRATQRITRTRTARRGRRRCAMTTKGVTMSLAQSRIRLRAALPLAVAGCLVTAVSASADATGSATPGVAGGKPTTVNLAVDGLAAPVSGRIPRSLVVTTPGFKLDRRAVALRCKELQAKLNECPKKSKIGTGTLTIIVHRPDRDNEVAFDVVMYHGKGTKVLAVTDFIGIRVIPARLTESGGVRLSFDPLPEPPVIPGVEITYEFKGVSVRLGVTRKVVKRVGPQRKRRSFRHSLVSTPETCKGGSWPATATLGFPDGASVRLPTPMACKGR